MQRGADKGPIVQEENPKKEMGSDEAVSCAEDTHLCEKYITQVCGIHSIIHGLIVCSIYVVRGS